MLSQKVRFPFYGHIIFHCANVQQFFFIHSCTDRHLGCFQILVIISKTAVNIGLNTFSRITVLGLFGYIQGMGLLNQKAVPFLVF